MDIIFFGQVPVISVDVSQLKICLNFLSTKNKKKKELVNRVVCHSSDLCHISVYLPVCVCVNVCSCSGCGQRSLSPVTTPQRRVQRRRWLRPVAATTACRNTLLWRGSLRRPRLYPPGRAWIAWITRVKVPLTDSFWLSSFPFRFYQFEYNFV